MENKQKAIEKAYGEHWEAVKDYVDENGWIDAKKLDWDFMPPRSCVRGENNTWASAEIQLIETNNDWIKIESEADLPKDDSVNYDMYNKNGRVISDLPLKTIIQLFEKGIITHYAIHVQRKPPIY